MARFVPSSRVTMLAVWCLYGLICFGVVFQRHALSVRLSLATDPWIGLGNGIGPFAMRLSQLNCSDLPAVYLSGNALHAGNGLIPEHSPALPRPKLS